MSEHQYHTLGKFLGQPNFGQHLASSEELKAAYERIATLESTLNECRSYFEERADADCDQDGFIPNEEMTLMVEIDQVLA